jgi:hypothetical protein
MSIIVNTLKYNLVGNTAKMTGSTNTSLPSLVYSNAFFINSGINGGQFRYTVQFIENGAFYYFSSLQSVMLQDLLIAIGYRHDESTPADGVNIFGSFQNCIQLSSVVLTTSTTLATIGPYSFYNCIALPSITIPISVTYIGAYAFSNCTGLISVTIPTSLTYIGENPFSGCTNLSNVTISGNGSVNSILSGAFKNIVSCKTVIINNATSIGASAFTGCINVTSVTIPSSVTSIGESAFNGCSNLETITIPISVTSIGVNAFPGTTQLISTYTPTISSIYYHSNNTQNFIKVYLSNTQIVTNYSYSTDGTNYIQLSPVQTTSSLTINVSSNSAISIKGIGNRIVSGYTINITHSGSTSVIPTTLVNMVTNRVVMSTILSEFTITEIKAQYTASDLKTAGYTLSDLQTFGYSLIDLKNAGYTFLDLKNAGYTLEQMLNNGFTITQILEEGKIFDMTTILTLFTSSQIKTQFSAAYLKTAGYTLSELQTVGYTLSELQTSGFDLQTGGYTLSDLKIAGYTSADILNSGFTITQLLESSIFDKLGGDIDGLSGNDWFGWSVSLSSDGLILAIGAPFNDSVNTNSGQVRVYKYISGTWTQLGQVINATPRNNTFNDNTGYTVSLSGDGLTLAIGAPYNDAPPGGIGYQNNGAVSIYTYTTNVWTQLGNKIYGKVSNAEDPTYDGGVTQGRFGTKAGWSVSLNNSGRIVAIGAPYNYTSDVIVYKYDTNGWYLISTNIPGTTAYERSGWSVSLNDEGSIVAIGAPNNSVIGNKAGKVTMYKTNTNGAWEQLGGVIYGEAAEDLSGWSVSLSSDGLTVAIGGRLNRGTSTNTTDYRGHVRVYKYTSGSWTKLGGDIDGEAAGDQSGVSVSLSGDGLTLAIGAHTNDGTSTDTSDNRGHVRVYKYISGAWNKLSGDIDGESAGDLSGRSLSLSSDGTTIAIGAPLNDGTSTNTNDDRGHVRVYKIMDMSYIPYGVTLLNLKTAGYSAENLKTAGYSAENLKTAGYSIENLKTAGYSAENLKTAGYSAIKLEMAGYLLTDINNLNYTNVEVETSGELTYALNLSSQNKPIVLTSDIDLRQVPSILYSNTVKQITSSKEIKIYVS